MVYKKNGGEQPLGRNTRVICEFAHEAIHACTPPLHFGCVLFHHIGTYIRRIRTQTKYAFSCIRHQRGRRSWEAKATTNNPRNSTVLGSIVALTHVSLPNHHLVKPRTGQATRQEIEWPADQWCIVNQEIDCKKLATMIFFTSFIQAWVPSQDSGTRSTPCTGQVNSLACAL